MAELHKSRDVEYPPLATLFGVAVLYLAEALPEGAERLTALRPEETRGAGPARDEVALGLVLFAVDVACLAFVYFLARRVYPDDDRAKLLARLALYVAATTAIGLILYDRQDLVVGLVAVMMLAAFVRGWSLAAYAVLAIGVAYKLVPLLLASPVRARLRRDEDRARFDHALPACRAHRSRHRRRDPRARPRAHVPLLRRRARVRVPQLPLETRAATRSVARVGGDPARPRHADSAIRSAATRCAAISPTASPVCLQSPRRLERYSACSSQRAASGVPRLPTARRAVTS